MFFGAVSYTHLDVYKRQGYKNSKGDTIIPIGKYKYCYTDTIKTFGIVMTNKNALIGIDRNENQLLKLFGLIMEQIIFFVDFSESFKTNKLVIPFFYYTLDG